MQSLEEAKTMPSRKKLPPSTVSNQIPSIQEHKGFSTEKLDREILYEDLTTGNYLVKFRFLLMLEEEEHDRILKEKYDENLLQSYIILKLTLHFMLQV